MSKDSIVDKMNQDDGSKVTPPEKKEEPTKSPTLEEVVKETSSDAGQEDPNDEPKGDSKDKAIISLKRDLKESKKTQEEMREAISELTNFIKAERSQRLSDEKIAKFAEEQGIDPKTLKALKEVLREEDDQPRVKKDAKKKIEDKEDEDDEDENEEPEVPPTKKTFDKKRLGQAVDKMVEDFLEDMPEYADIVDEDYIKELILENPTKYSKQSMAEIVEKVYGKQLKGKDGIETPSKGGRDATKPKTRGKLSPKEFDQIKDDPEALKDYKSGLIDRVSKFAI